VSELDGQGTWPPPNGTGWTQRPQRPLPPRPVHHEPGYSGPGRPAESPWRRSQRLSRPESSVPGPPLSGRPEGNPPGPGQFQFHPPDPQGPHDQYDPQDQYGPQDRYGPRDQYGEYPAEEGDEPPDRFMPGFGDYPETEEPAAPAGRTPRGGRGRAQPGGRPPRRPRRRRFRWLAPLAALLVIVVPLAIGGAYAYSFYMSRYHPPDYPGAGTGQIVVHVPSGASPTSFGPQLQQLGVVASARAFVLAAEHAQNPNGLLPGFYGMRKHMKASLAYAALLNPKNLVQISVTIPEGWRTTQVVRWLGAKSGIPASAYDQVLKNPAQLHLPAYANGNPEGYLFPATYTVQPHETALGVLTGMVQRFNQEAAAVNLPAAAQRVHLSPASVVIMASLVQAEGGRISDYQKIARVIYNRLARHMPLQLDSTVLYGLHTFGILASDAQLNSPSPYNTYKHKGLTPGPIDSPGAAAIQAVLHPASGPWLYFVTVNPKTRETKFTSSQAQFEQFRAELEHNLGKR
jgi:peptidoglycan lytic transglycosylase G